MGSARLPLLGGSRGLPDMIHVLRDRCTPAQLAEMLEALELYVKLTVDIQRGILAGGGVLHADCEEVLLAQGSRQEDIWGADRVPSSQEVRYEALINLRPHQKNTEMTIRDPSVRAQVEEILRRLMGDV